MNYKKIIQMVWVVVILIIICGCSLNSKTTNMGYDSPAERFENPYTREAIDFFSSQEGFGGGRLDASTVVAKYIYDDESLVEKYGKDFCIEDIGGNCSNSSLFFLGVFKGTGNYFVEIQGDTWRVKLSKSYLGGWEVTNCYQEG